jgi:hypothetical protein
VFSEFFYRTRSSWSRSRRVVAKAEHLARGENPRFLVTSLPAQDWPAQTLYEQLYCARGEMENRIKEQLSLFSDRLSTETLRASQLRLYFSSLGYVLVHALRRPALGGTEWAPAQVQTIRLKLLKIAAHVRVTAHLGTLRALLPLENDLRRGLASPALLNPDATTQLKDDGNSLPEVSLKPRHKPFVPLQIRIQTLISSRHPLRSPQLAAGNTPSS